MAVTPQEVYALWCSKRYMQALQTVWKLSGLYTYMSLPRDMPPRELVVRACREAVTQAEQGRHAESQQWLAGFLQHFTPPAALVDYEEGRDSAAVAYRSTRMLVHLRCAEVALDRPWTSTTVAQAALQPVADETSLPLGFLRDLVQELLPEAPGGPQYRLAEDTCTLAVLLVDEARNEGVVANLTLERLPDGTGVLYPAPELSFVYGDDAWQQAMQNASAYVKQTLWQQGWDVRWRLARRDHQPLPPFLKGGSLGAALAISFVASSRNWLWFINLWLIFGHSYEKPRYGKNSRLLQDFPTGPRDVQLAWSHLVTVPRPQPLQLNVGMLLAGDDEPQGPGGGQE